MKKTTQALDVSSPQTVTDFIKVHEGQRAIKIRFTDQKISGSVPGAVNSTTRTTADSLERGSTSCDAGAMALNSSPP
jgi:hypothetical protein